MTRAPDSARVGSAAEALRRNYVDQRMNLDMAARAAGISRRAARELLARDGLLRPSGGLNATQAAQRARLAAGVDGARWPPLAKPYDPSLDRTIGRGPGYAHQDCPIVGEGGRLCSGERGHGGRHSWE